MVNAVVHAAAEPDHAPSDVGDAAPRPARFSHVPALDGLRGAAVAAVLLYHGSLLSRTWLAGGYLGVDLFFVLSGFLITSLLLVEFANEGRVDLLAFWGRRFRRLVPALLVVLVGVALYAVLFARRVDLGQIRRDGLATLLYVANWGSILRGVSYWDISLAPSPLQHTWSLAIEEQFYLFWPLIVWALARRTGSRDRERGVSLARRIRKVALIGAVASVWLFVGLSALGASDTRVYQGTDTRAVALLLGVAVATMRFERKQRVTPLGDAAEIARLNRLEGAGIVAMVLLGWAWVSLEGTSRVVYQGLLPACSVAAAVVIAAAAEPSSPVLGRIFSFAPLRWLGFISYGLYLWHWPMYLVLTPSRTGLDGLALLAVRMLASVAIAGASYVLVEQPIRRRRWHVRQPVPSAGLAFAGVAAVLVLATVGAVDPVGNITNDAPRRALADVKGAPRVLFIGDSVAVSLSLPVVLGPARYGVNPYNEARIGCALAADGRKVQGGAGNIITQKPCLADMERAARKIHPDVVVAAFGARPNNPIDIGGAFRGACTPQYRRLLRRKATDLVQTLSGHGAAVELATVARSDGAFAPPDEPANVDCFNADLRMVAAASPRVDLLDLDGYVCPRGQCRENVDAGQIRPDGLHFSGPGGESVSRWVVRQAVDGLRR